ncbi:11005_t:CDS:2 [Scutellospora calospora]|uniref:11005_t:CDS:1 n=1 Tax=Scutellospora calospora TaxID=85575 RepID=A0ACA9M4D5_9GLOM|nr:11005_t:CDS:2 [Scutellospora calospora]
MSTDFVNDPSEMKFRSSFSYKNDNIRNSIQIPNGVALRDTLNNFNETPQVVNGFGTYFVSWISNYVLLLNSIAVFALKNQKQQSMEGVDGFRYSMIEQ